MAERLIDAHIHLDHYNDDEIASLLTEDVEALVSVSMNLESCKRNLALAEKFPKVKPTFGYHPEQPLPTEQEFEQLISWMTVHQEKMVAIGEVGLPYFLRAEQQITPQQYSQYIELLEVFLKLAKKWDKPIALHAVYSDAPVVCNLLEKHSITRAHFHWFKGDRLTTQRMMKNGYFVSLTPEVVMDDQDNLDLVQIYPIDQIMLESDGPWPYEGPFIGKRTCPVMIKESLKKIAEIKELSMDQASSQIRANTKGFYRLT